MKAWFKSQTGFRVTVLFIIGVLSGWFAHDVLGPQNIRVIRGSILRLDNAGYQFIDPVLTCEVGPEAAFPELKPTKDAVNQIVTQAIKTGVAQNISIYLRSAKTGRWFEINGNNTYAPASLLKVFIMMAYYKEAEDNPSILEKTVAFEAHPSVAHETPGAIIPHLTPGALYTINKLIEQMIIYSDNDALNTLVDHFNPKTLEALQGIFKDLNIPSPLTQDESKLNFMSVSSYSMAFRVLFSSTYLGRKYSEQALELLSHAKYRDGIVAGVPENISVAHKFGVSNRPTQPNRTVATELHDCGIVYYPEHPYLLCIMTRGSDFGSLQNVIQKISRTVYRELDTFFTNLPKPVVRTAATSTQ